LLAHVRWFPPGIPASSTTKTGRHDIAEIMLKVALITINQSINQRRPMKTHLSAAFRFGADALVQYHKHLCG
jgi:hypothetical protein